MNHLEYMGRAPHGLSHRSGAQVSPIRRRAAVVFRGFAPACRVMAEARFSMAGRLARGAAWRIRAHRRLEYAGGAAYPRSRVLVIRQLCRRFREGERVHPVLDHASAEVRSGEAVAVIGRSGSGKSTLLNLISGIDRPDSGAVEIDGRELTAMGEPARTLFRRARIGFVYQFFNLIPTLDVEENVRLALELNGIRGAAARQRSAAVLAEVGLGDRLHSPVDRLSGGEQQRVAIARALAHEPGVLLADEPTGNLDEETSSQVLRVLLAASKSRGTTLVIVTHDAWLAHSADRILELHEGKLATARAPVRRTGLS
jgi:putative ABC transport system ATP-binding protein